MPHPSACPHTNPYTISATPPLLITLSCTRWPHECGSPAATLLMCPSCMPHHMLTADATHHHSLPTTSGHDFAHLRRCESAPVDPLIGPGSPRGTPKMMPIMPCHPCSSAQCVLTTAWPTSPCFMVQLSPHQGRYGLLSAKEVDFRF